MATKINTPRDPNTLANYNYWRTVHTFTKFEIVFDQQKLQGSVIHSIKSITGGETDEILLDSSHVQIHNVKADGKAVKWEFLPRAEPYGSPLKIQLNRKVGLDERVNIEIDLETTPSCTALQWLTPAQTSNKKHPYMFSQCEAIHARSIFPCQDTPDVKATFDFEIRSPLPVIASGVGAKDNPTSPSSDGSAQLFKFHQGVPIPSYLFALASGDIATAKIGPRSIVATGPEELHDCQWELEKDTEKFLKAAESLVFPYVWGEYDVLVLPPSFPYGGMENPIYTFATPTMISGDRQNVDVIAHELSHSWSGNLVTNASWEHFWLNEGWTTYLERRIQSIVHGGDRWRDFSAIIGWKAMSDSIEQYGPDHEFTKLVIDLKGKDPDDAFSSIPYEKGFNFLYYIEKLISKEEFDKFIPHYFETWRGKSLDSYEFKATLLNFFKDDDKVSTKLAEIDWDTWFYKPGHPPKPDFDTSLVDVAYKLAEQWEKFTRNPNPDFGPSKFDVDGWTANQLVVFLECLLAFERPLPVPHVNYMGFIYDLKETRNVEVSSRYYQVAMQSGDFSIKGFVTKLLGEVGRMKFVRPLFRGLMKLDYELAVQTFEKNKDFYHPICRALVAKDLFGTK
ncbi:leukotriene A-4 hydrolase/aminopeptidase [Rhinocladiella mackenziei CBS 650.93]|uniref:Leukotriene A(4) hydrolase n=1 Tax=Rhinocladiella mackenziei CBS 650.93 TaxID=1442369 RepID=A0A0D2I6E3_9EURO|nr:leukotriene A-4 hydrolase/aminopeptidase [Rhinocladiella mackenziei CBS 650.93]KIX01374.1 leukotriene A-4 hydrolase/aminopeptidase [Rhinocladiella mackenziei CBS 650.93]